MKRFAPFFLLLCIIVMTACTTPTTTTILPEEYHYIFYQDVVYLESPEGFSHDDDVIWVDVQSDRTVYTASFFEATVTVFTDGSLNVLYEDGWNAVCPAEATIEGCSVSAINPTHSAEVILLLDFGNVTILTGEYTPIEELPTYLSLATLKLLIIIVLGLIVFYRVLLIVIPAGARGRFYPSKSMLAGIFNKNPGGGRGDSAKTFWANADVAVGSMKDEYEDHYGKKADSSDQTPPTTLRDRYHAQRSYLLVSVLVFILTLVAMLLWSCELH